MKYIVFDYGYYTVKRDVCIWLDDTYTVLYPDGRTQLGSISEAVIILDLNPSLTNDERIGFMVRHGLAWVRGTLRDKYLLPAEINVKF